MRRLLALLTVLAAAAVIVPAGAGATVAGKSKPRVKLTGKVNNHGTNAVKGTTIEVEQDDYYFEPTFIKAKPGTSVTVELKNEGKTEHNFSITGMNISQDVMPDQKATVTVTVPASGHLAFFCRFHQSFGMQGAIFTKAGTTTAKSNPSS